RLGLPADQGLSGPYWAVKRDRPRSVATASLSANRGPAARCACRSPGPRQYVTSSRSSGAHGLAPCNSAREMSVRSRMALTSCANSLDRHAPAGTIGGVDLIHLEGHVGPIDGVPLGSYPGPARDRLVVDGVVDWKHERVVPHDDYHSANPLGR